MTRTRAMTALWFLALASCGGGGGSGAGPITLPAPTPAPTPTPPPAGSDGACVAGSWSVAATDPDDRVNGPLPVQYETAAFAFRWQGGFVPMADDRAAGEHLAFVWGGFFDRFGRT